MTNTYEATMVQHGYPIEENMGTLEDMRIWANKVLSSQDGYVEIVNPETGEHEETRTKITIKDQTGNIVSTVIDEEETAKTYAKDYVSHHQNWTLEYWTDDERGSRQVGYENLLGSSVTIVISPTDVADWATQKYGEDALYMLEGTQEGTEVFGETMVKAGVAILKARGYK